MNTYHRLLLLLVDWNLEVSLLNRLVSMSQRNAKDTTLFLKKAEDVPAGSLFLNFSSLYFFGT